MKKPVEYEVIYEGASGDTENKYADETDHTEVNKDKDT